jgi:hypothetical protein
VGIPPTKIYDRVNIEDKVRWNITVVRILK